MQVSNSSLMGSPLAAAQTQDTSSTSGSDSSTSASTANTTVTANDFLELLVSEMKNQDPTADTDPNQYINQLVQVNSLEQLVQINQDLTPSASTSGTGTGSTATAPGATSSTTGAAAPTPGATAPAASPVASASGNLSTPNPGNSASRVAAALGTAAHTLAPSSSASPLDSVLSTLRARAQQARTSTSNPAH